METLQHSAFQRLPDRTDEVVHHTITGGGRNFQMKFNVQIGIGFQIVQALGHRDHGFFDFGQLFGGVAVGRQNGALNFEGFAHFHQFHHRPALELNSALKEKVKQAAVDRFNDSPFAVDDLDDAQAGQRT